MNSKPDAEPGVEQKSCLACWCPERTSPGCQTGLLPTPGKAADGGLAEWNTKAQFIVVKEKNEEPACCRAGQLPQV